MKTHRSVAGLALLAASLILTHHLAAASSPIKPAEPSAFHQVTAKLDPGGSLYVYLSTDQWLYNLSARIRDVRDMILMFPDISSQDRQHIEHIATLLENLARQSGLESITGVGISGIAVDKGLYRTRLVIQRAPDSNPNAYLWTLFGTKPHPLTSLDWLPADTALATSTDIDLLGLWRAVLTQTRSADLDSAHNRLTQLSIHVRNATGRSLEDHLASFGGELTLAVVLDNVRQFHLPIPESEPLTLPEPGLLLGIKVHDDYLFDWLDSVLAANPNSTRGSAHGARWRSLEIPTPFPLPLRITVARAGDYLWIASLDELLESALNTHANQSPGIQSTEEFLRLSRGLPTEANSFSFVSARLVETVAQIQKAVFEQSARHQAGPPAELMQRLIGFSSMAANYSVSWQDPDGAQSASQGTQEPATVLVSSALVAPTAIMAGMLLPALAKAKSKASENICTSHLRQIGLAMHLYADDHDDLLPPNYLVMQDELSTPIVLFCPNDPNQPDRQNLTWSNLAVSRSTYEFLTPGIKASDDRTTVVARCRIHGTKLLLDGSVHRP